MQTGKTYNSGIDGRLVAIMSFIFLSVATGIVLAGDWKAALVLLPIAAFIIHIFMGTRYTITGTTLNIRAGFIVNTTVDINTIKSITETDSLLSAPANSFDRIEIAYNKYDSVIISPKNKAAFIADILAINDDIKVSYKS